jgi:predicted small lipoprotein YifL
MFSLRTTRAALYGKTIPMQRFLLILAAIAFVGIAGCGQIGPLYLPDTPPPKSKDDSEFDAQPARQSPAQPSKQPSTQPSARQP